MRRIWVVPPEGKISVAASHRQMACGWRIPFRGVINLGVALLISGTLLLRANNPVSGHPVNTDLPTLRPDYGGISPNGKIGQFLDSVGPSWGPPMSLVNASLVQLLPSGKVVPDLATWKVSPNKLVYTFTIRKDARFSNGHVVTARDAAFSFQRVLTPAAHPQLVYLGLIRGATAYAHGTARTLSGVTIIDSRTIQLTITKPAAYFLTILTNISTVFDRTIVAGKPLGTAIEKVSTNYLTNTCAGNQGAGPFKFVCHDRSSKLHSFYSGSPPRYTLVPNPYYYGRKPHIKLELRSVGSDENRYKSYLKGSTDMSAIPTVFFNQWRGKSTQYHQFPTADIQYFVPNVHMAPFDNVHCRLAVSYALDRDKLVKVLGDTEHATYSVVPKGMLGYYPGQDNPHYNLSKARSELARCPGRTVPVELTVPTTFADPNASHFVARAYLDAGFNFKLKVISDSDWGALVSKPLDQSKTQLAFASWAQDYPDPQDYCTVLLRSGQPLAIGGWHNSAYDRLVDEADVTLNRKKRAQLYIQAQHIALNQGAFISVTNNIGYELIKPYVHGMIGTEAFVWIVPKNNDWANVSISPH